MIVIEPVSYTHLDVYKRQEMMWKFFVIMNRDFFLCKIHSETRIQTSVGIMIKACLLYTSDPPNDQTLKLYADEVINSHNNKPPDEQMTVQSSPAIYPIYIFL